MSNDNWSSCGYHFMPGTLMILLLLDTDSNSDSSDNVKPFKEKLPLLKIIRISSASCNAFSFVLVPGKQLSLFASGYSDWNFNEVSPSEYLV